MLAQGRLDGDSVFEQGVTRVIETVFRSLGDVRSEQFRKCRVLSPVDECPLAERFDKTVGY